MDSCSLSNSQEGKEDEQATTQMDEWDNLSNASSVIIGDPDICWETYDRIIQWFEHKGIKAGSPQEIIDDYEDKHRRQIMLKSESHLDLKPALSRRVKTISSLHIDLDFRHKTLLSRTS